MIDNKAIPVFFLLFFILTLLAQPALSQLNLGQYEDEAPLGTWNILGISTAFALSMGGPHFALAADSSAGFTNPALLPKLARFTLSVSSSFTAASLFKYSLVNTGVLGTDKNLTIGIFGIDFAGISLNLKGWAFAINLGLAEYYNRPKAEYTSSSRGQTNYSLGFQQEGFLRNLNFALSRRLGGRLALGLGINLITGKLEKKIEEKWPVSDITIIDRKSHNFSGYFFNAGFLLEVTERLTLGAMFRTPYKKESESESLLRYLAPPGNTDIRIGSSARNRYSQPWVIGMGLSYVFSDAFRLASDLSFFRWSSYKIKYFEEEIRRDFQDTVRISLGVEYMNTALVHNRRLQMPLRAGLGYDPQPMSQPDSAYLFFSFGTGVRWGKFSLDLAGLIGRERGSGDNLEARRIALSLGIEL